MMYQRGNYEVRPEHEHIQLLEKSGMVRPGETMNVDRLQIDERSITVHRIIAFDAGVLPERVVLDEEAGIVYADIPRSELEREGYTAETLKRKVEELLFERVEIKVVDVEDDF